MTDKKTITVKKLVYETIESPDGTDSYEMPVGWRRITTEEFAAHRLTSDDPVYIEHRQFDWDSDQVPYGKVRIHAMMLWDSDKTGIAIHKQWQSGGFANGEYVLSYFAFGCKHEYMELSQAQCHARKLYHSGRCWHTHECQKCHHINAYDSSD